MHLKVDRKKEKEEYRFHSITFVSRKLDPPALMNGKKVSRYEAPMRVFVNTVTGELVPESKLPHDSGVERGTYYGERILQRECVLKSLRPEVRKFAVFVLHFRNARRGIVAGIDQLVRWYARFNGMRGSNVRRYVPVLYEAGILGGETLLAPLFQKADPTMRADDHLGEEISAAVELHKWQRRVAMLADAEQAWGDVSELLAA